MFLRILGAFVLLLALLWVVLYASASAAMREAKGQPWPYGLGTVAQLAARSDTRSPSAEANTISEIVRTLDLEESSPDAYVAAQTAKNDDAVDAVPETAGLKGHEAAVAELARVTVGVNGRIVWGAPGAPWMLDDAAELLGVSALDLARNGDAAGAWERAYAIWLLARSVSLEPYGAEMALRMKRAANAVARKLPPPVPAWAAEMAAVEPRRDTAAFIQQNIVSRLGTMPALPGPLIVLKPLSDLIEASNLRRARAATEIMSKAPRCRIDTSQEFAEAAEIYRASRIEAEIEATAKILALKTERARLGRWPAALADAASRCSGSRWIYEAKPDGASMKLGMSWAVAAEPGVKSAPALEFAY